MKPTDEQINKAAEAIVQEARLHADIKTLADVDARGPENVGCIPFDPRALAKAALSTT